MTISPPAAVLGVQRPRVLRQPPAASSAGQEAVELARAAGLELDPWQQFALEVSLAERRDGSYAAFEVGLIVPRQNGKGAVLEARELFGLFLGGEQLILHSAHQFPTARESFLRMRQLIESTPDLERRVAKVLSSNQEVAIILKSGQRLRYLARSTGGGRGFTGDLVILDEAFNLDANSMGALLPTLSARPNPQVWYASSAPMATSSHLHAVRNRALSNERIGRLAWLEWSVDPDDYAMDDIDSWAQANPALGIRIGAEFITDELNALHEDEFKRERLGIPDIPTSEQQSAIPESAWQSCADPASVITGPTAFALDVSLDRSQCAVDAVGRRADGRVHVETIRHEPGGEWVVDFVAGLLGRHDAIGLALDPAGPAGSLIPALVRKGVDPKLISGRQLAQSCGRLTDLVVEDQFRHLGQPSLNAAVLGASRRRLGDAWAWQRRQGADICPLVAATVGLWLLESVEAAPEPAPFVMSLGDL